MGRTKEGGHAEDGQKLPYMVGRVFGQNLLLSRLRIPSLNCVGEIVQYERVCVINATSPPNPCPG
jgi:hypothetical protein